MIHYQYLQDQDVKIEDILNAPSLSISLKTATDAGAFLCDDRSNGVNNSFFRSDIKRSHIKQIKTNNDSYILYQEDDSMIKDLMQEERLTINKGNSNVFNIIDDNN